MKLSENVEQHLKEMFAQVANMDDFVNLLNYTKSLLYGEGCYQFKTKDIVRYTNPSINKLSYKSFTIPKKSGGG